MHKSVLLEEVLAYLSPKDGEVYVDVTFGAGGYTRAVLEAANCTVVALDRDSTVAETATKFKAEFGERFQFFNTEFSKIDEVLAGAKVNGIMADFGVSSMQLDTPERGFSFLRPAPLDMRMGAGVLSAAKIVNEFSEYKLAEIIAEFGEERLAKKIASHIVRARSGGGGVKTTTELASIVQEAYGKEAKFSKIHPATKTFQAIRIYINNELGEIEALLEKAKSCLKTGGRLVCVSFHSLEDGLVKSFFNANSKPKVKENKYPKGGVQAVEGYPFEVLTKKPIEPSDEEVRANIRARSAKLRAGVFML